MRILALATLAAVSVGLMDARPASAAWTCSGAEYVCGGAKATKHKATKKAAKQQYGKKATRAATAQRTTKKQAKRSTGGSYSGGGSHGIASFYWQPQRVASGGYFNPNALTAAHRSLPFGTRVLVTNQRNGRSVTVTINDRGPFIKGRIIDLSKRAAGVIGMTGSGIAPVSIQVVGRG